MLRVVLTVGVMAGLLSGALADTEDPVVNKNVTSLTPDRTSGSRGVGGARSGGAVFMARHRAQAVSIIRELSKLFRHSDHHKKVSPQYRWLSEGPSGLSFPSNRIKKSKMVQKKEKTTDDGSILQHQFRFHVIGSSQRPTDTHSEDDHVVSVPKATDDSNGEGFSIGQFWTWTIRPKSMPPLAPNAKDVSLIVRKRNRETKETGYYIFESLESLLKHNKLHDFRLTPTDEHKA